jgi:hypothetical protein
LFSGGWAFFFAWIFHLRTAKSGDTARNAASDSPILFWHFPDCRQYSGKHILPRKGPKRKVYWHARREQLILYTCKNFSVRKLLKQCILTKSGLVG